MRYQELWVIKEGHFLWAVLFSMWLTHLPVPLGHGGGGRGQLTNCKAACRGSMLHKKEI